VPPVALLKTLMADKSAWEEVTFEEGSDEPISYMKPIPIS